MMYKQKRVNYHLNLMMLQKPAIPAVGSLFISSKTFKIEMKLFLEKYGGRYSRFCKIIMSYVSCRSVHLVRVLHNQC